MSKISTLREQLRAMGVKDENMFFDDNDDGSITPRLVFQSHEVVVLAEAQTASSPQAEKHGLSDSPDKSE